jgi:uncharacterized protein DUF3631
MTKLVPLDAIQDEEPAKSLGAWVLNQVEAYIGRFVSYPSEHARAAHALWIAHAHLMDCWASTPRIAFNSPERGSGKTRALEVTEPLVPNPVHAVNVTPAYLFRKVGDQSGPPTILYDEVDTLFASKVLDSGEVRGLLNAGHRRGAVAGRCVVIGNRVQTEEIPAYCAVALAGLGDLPDTIASRSILIEMQRRAPDEPVEPFRHSVHGAQGAAIREVLADWCSEISATLHDAKPSMPDLIKDRDADCWEPLFAIADAAHGDWPQRARAAAVSLVNGATERTQTSGVQLLSDLRDVFFGEAEKLATRTILDGLHALPESPWADIHGRPLNERGLATRLRKYGIKPKKLRIGDNTVRGYEVADFHDAWKRYLPAPRQEAEQVEQVEQPHAKRNARCPETREKFALVPDVPHVPLYQERGAGVPDAAEAADDFEERAAILEYDAGYSRAKAEASAAEEFPELPASLDRRRWK